ncbi:trypsin-like peptidase domain-containing protein [Streptomyces laculatispora]|uniref:Trypsin-like peptidase domain-containing protein n=1 Tax=Streptomyces laculatispora TaxID=887464 RepID=A0ABY9I3D7_9ACTN|nr:trypsin-like peptidase domain-containing protein [Streptomyces laculatispora]WLQ40844.1 trypsin-like peptidase domain-containing protein [Streptomyces laculatispora]
MDDGKPTEPKAKWWSRPTAGRSTSTAPQEPSPVEDAVPPVDATGASDGAEAEPEGPATAETLTAETVPQAARPLHEPDPYSTPPYGGPGPWAPAPPVQRPVPTPAHGTPVPPPYAGTNGAGITTASAPPPAPPAAFPPPAPLPQQPQAQPQHQSQQPQHSQPHPQQPQPPSPQWLQYDPWGAPRQPLITNPGPPLGTDGGRRKNRRGSVLVGALLLALVAGGIGGGIGAYMERNGGLTQVELPQDERDGGGRAPDSVAGIAASALPSVVTLHVSGSTESGTGTGFVLDNKGHILTNNHVVAPAGSSGEITVTFSGGETANAEVVGKDSGYDLAVVKVSGVSGLKPLPLGNSDNVQVGDPVVAIGAPFDLSNTVTSGIISAKDRPITAGGEKGDGSDISYVDALQTDAPINPGNSGGPLVDTDAHVIGINSAIRAADSGSTTEGGQAGSIGLGFAIPINQGKRVAEELINTGKATHPVIGVTLDMKYTGDGAKVGEKGADGKSSVTPDGPGAKAGIEPGDIITEVDGGRVHSGEELIVKIRSHRPGDRLDLRLTRGGKDLTMTLTLGTATGT